MPGKYPEGRCGTSEFCRIAGVSKTVFFTRYRNDPAFIRRWDIRIDALNRLNMSRAAAELEARQRAGRPAHGNAGRVMRRECPACTAMVHNRCNECRFCGYAFRWSCGTCRGRTDAAATTCATCGATRPA